MSTLKTDAIQAATGTNTDLTLAGKGTGVPDLAAGFKVGSVAGVPTASIRDDAVTLAKLAAGTDGELITWDASGDPAAVAVGTATHVLTSNGAGAAPTFQAAAAGGAWTLIQTQNLTGSVASIEFTSGITSTYSTYVVVIAGLETTGSDAGILECNVSEDGGSTWNTSAYRYHTSATTYDSTSYVGKVGDDTLEICQMSADSDAGMSGMFFLYAPDATRNNNYTWVMGGCQGVYVYHGSGASLNSVAKDGLKFFMGDGGNMDAGRLTLYGVSHT